MHIRGCLFDLMLVDSIFIDRFLIRNKFGLGKRMNEKNQIQINTTQTAQQKFKPNEKK